MDTDGDTKLGGGFAWLEPDLDATPSPDGAPRCTTTTELGWVEAKEGRSSSVGGDKLAQCVAIAYATKEPVFIPVFGDIDGKEYRIVGYAAFFITGYMFNNVGDDYAKKVKSDITGTFCSTSPADDCLTGFFSEDLIPVPTGIEADPDYDLGLTAIGLTG